MHMDALGVALLIVALVSAVRASSACLDVTDEVSALLMLTEEQTYQRSCIARTWQTLAQDASAPLVHPVRDVLRATLGAIADNPGDWMGAEMAQAVRDNLPYLSSPMNASVGTSLLKTRFRHVLPILIMPVRVEAVFRTLGVQDVHAIHLAFVARQLSSWPAGPRVRAAGSVAIALQMWTEMGASWPAMALASARLPAGSFEEWGGTWSAIDFASLWLHIHAVRTLLAGLNNPDMAFELLIRNSTNECANAAVAESQRVHGPSAATPIAAQLACIRDELYALVHSGADTWRGRQNPRLLKRIERMWAVHVSLVTAAVTMRPSRLVTEAGISSADFGQFSISLRLLFPDGLSFHDYAAQYDLLRTYAPRNASQGSGGSQAEYTEAGLPKMAHVGVFTSTRRVLRRGTFAHQARKLAAALGTEVHVAYVCLRTAYATVWARGAEYRAWGPTSVPVSTAVRLLNLQPVSESRSGAMLADVLDGYCGEKMTFAQVVALVFAKMGVARPLIASGGLKTALIAHSSAAADMREAAIHYQISLVDEVGLVALGFVTAVHLLSRVEPSIFASQPIRHIGDAVMQHAQAAFPFVQPQRLAILSAYGRVARHGIVSLAALAMAAHDLRAAETSRRSSGAIGQPRFAPVHPSDEEHPEGSLALVEIETSFGGNETMRSAQTSQCTAERSLDSRETELPFANGILEEPTETEHTQSVDVQHRRADREQRRVALLASVVPPVTVSYAMDASFALLFVSHLLPPGEAFTAERTAEMLPRTGFLFEFTRGVCGQLFAAERTVDRGTLVSVLARAIYAAVGSQEAEHEETPVAAASVPPARRFRFWY